MNITTKVPMTVEQFLAWDDQQEGKHEFDGKDVIEMVGSAAAHEFIVANLIYALMSRTRGTAFRVMASSFRLRAGPAVRLPDVQVYDRSLEARATIADDPVAVFEVLSPSTARTDRIAKAANYWAAPSIAHYILVEQSFMGVFVHSRGASAWLQTSVGDAEDLLELPALGLSIPLSEIYDGITFPTQHPA